MKNSFHCQFFLKLSLTLIVFTLLTNINSADAQSNSTSTGPTIEQLRQAEIDRQNSLYPPAKPNPYENLTPAEQAKLPISAQLPDIKEQISIDVSPEIPQPGQTVTISASAFGGINIDSAEINWLINGKSVLKGRGEKKLIFQVGSEGKLMTVELHIRPQYGAEVVKIFRFNPSEVDVLWQANTYTPPFYKGKALYTPEADVQFVAIPNIVNRNGTSIQPAKTSYDWQIDYKNYADKSGFGKSSYNFSGSILAKPTTVRVSAYNPLDKASAGVGTLYVEPIQPLLLMYEIHPTYGPLFSTAAVGTYNFGAEDIQLGAYPYFFSATSKQTLIYDWKINGIDLNLPQNQTSITLQKIKQESGQSTITVQATSDDKVLQQSDSSLSLIY